MKLKGNSITQNQYLDDGKKIPSKPKTSAEEQVTYYSATRATVSTKPRFLTLF